MKILSARSSYKYTDEDDLPDVNLISTVNDWLLGEYMGKKVPESGVKALIEVGKWFSKNYPSKTTTLYRFIAVREKKPDTSKKTLLNKNAISSWTDSLEKAQYFYEKIAAFGDGDQGKVVGYIVSAKISSSNILFSYPALKSFIEDCDPKMIRNAYYTEYKSLSKYVKDEFYKNQAEYVCIFPKGKTIPVKLVCYFAPTKDEQFMSDADWTYV